MNPETITSKLHAEADAELKSEITSLLAGAVKLTNTIPSPLEVNVAWTETQTKVFASTAIKALSKAVFEHQKDDRRTRHVNAFLARIAELESKVEDLAQYRD